MEECYLFVYGTLRKAFSLSVPENIARHIKLIGSGDVQGRLYNIGNYPGGTPDNSGKSYIRGEIVLITEPSKVFKYLDHYEGFYVEDPLSSEYRRKKESVKLDNGSLIEAWIYWYNLEVTENMRIIENDYIKFLQKN